MKVAILLSGRIYESANIYNNIIDMLIKSNSINDIANDVDFFITYPKDTAYNIVEQVTKLYNPKKILENDEKHFDINNVKYERQCNVRPKNILCMHLSRLRLRDIFTDYISETKPQYDFIIATRMDLYFRTILQIDTILPNIKKDELCIPNPRFDYSGINDQFAVGNYATIYKYLSTYDSLYKLLVEDKVLFHPETLLLEYIRRNHVAIHRFELDYCIYSFSKSCR
jgi:hypothetical protein